jgi:HSP20 family protein
MKADDLRQGVEAFWDKLNHGFAQWREAASGALTRFRPGQHTQLPEAADIDVPSALVNPGWGLIGSDLYEDERRLVLRLEVPGMSREDFDVEVLPDEVRVRGEKRFDSESTQGRWRVMQCAYGSFERRVALPVAVDCEAVRAVYRDGVLKVDLPKAAGATPRSVTIPVA